MTMKPPFSYYGGKQRMATKIIPYIPKHTVYVEPFCGGATLLFRKPWPEITNKNNYIEYINDSDGLVANFFEQLKTNGKQLTERLSSVLYSEKQYQKSVLICKNPDLFSDIEKAEAFYTNIQMSFSHILSGGWGRGVYSKNQPCVWDNAKDLYKYIDRMSTVGVCNRDALEIIKQYDSPQTFFYCDPPYPGTNQGSYSGYTQEDFKRLFNLLNTCKGSAILSCYNQDIVICERWKKVEFSSVCSASGKGKTNSDRSRKARPESLGDRNRTEVIYIKKASKPRSEIQKLYDSGKYNCFEGR